MSQNDSPEPVTVTDKRRIDPRTGEIRESATGPAPSGPAPEAAPGSRPGPVRIPQRAGACMPWPVPPSPVAALTHVMAAE